MSCSSSEDYTKFSERRSTKADSRRRLNDVDIGLQSMGRKMLKPGDSENTMSEITSR